MYLAHIYNIKLRLKFIQNYDIYLVYTPEYKSYTLKFPILSGDPVSGQSMVFVHLIQRTPLHS